MVDSFVSRNIARYLPLGIHHLPDLSNDAFSKRTNQSNMLCILTYVNALLLSTSNCLLNHASKNGVYVRSLA